jgi:chromosomal replication initiation ATPase DnaA
MSRIAPITCSLLDTTKPDCFNNRSNDCIAKLIIKLVYQYFELPKENLLVRRKFTRIVYPRQMAMFLINSYTGMKYGDVSFCCGGWDRATVIASIQTIKDRASIEESVRQDLDNIILIITKTKPDEQNLSNKKKRAVSRISTPSKTYYTAQQAQLFAFESLQI